MAQLVEQLIRNQQVAGSNPAISSKKRKDGFLRSSFFVIYGFEPRFAPGEKEKKE